MGDITDRAACGDAVQRGLDDGVGLGVDGAHTVTLDHQVPGFVTVCLPGGRAVKTGGQDAFIKHQDAAHQGPVAGRTLRNGVSNLHEIRIPIRAHGFPFRLKRCEWGVMLIFIISLWTFFVTMRICIVIAVAARRLFCFKGVK